MATSEQEARAVIRRKKRKQKPRRRVIRIADQVHCQQSVVIIDFFRGNCGQLGQLRRIFQNRALVVKDKLDDGLCAAVFRLIYLYFFYMGEIADCLQLCGVQLAGKAAVPAPLFLFNIFHLVFP